MLQIKLLLMVIMLAGGASGYFYVQKLRADNQLTASKPSEINPECWRLANPNFDPNAQSDAWKEKNL